MNREAIVDAIRHELRRQAARGMVVVMTPTSDPDVFHVHGQIDLVEIAQAIRDARH